MSHEEKGRRAMELLDDKYDNKPEAERLQELYWVFDVLLSPDIAAEFRQIDNLADVKLVSASRDWWDPYPQSPLQVLAQLKSSEAQKKREERKTNMSADFRTYCEQKTAEQPNDKEE